MSGGFFCATFRRVDCPCCAKICRCTLHFFAKGGAGPTCLNKYHSYHSLNKSHGPGNRCHMYHVNHRKIHRFYYKRSFRQIHVLQFFCFFLFLNSLLFAFPVGCRHHIHFGCMHFLRMNHPCGIDRCCNHCDQCHNVRHIHLQNQLLHH